MLDDPIEITEIKKRQWWRNKDWKEVVRMENMLKEGFGSHNRDHKQQCLWQEHYRVHTSIYNKELKSRRETKDEDIEERSKREKWRKANRGNDIL